MSGKNKITLNFIINGTVYPVEANLHEPLRVARDKALHKAEQTGRENLDDWEVRYGKDVLSPSAKIEELGLPDGAELEVTLGFGAGG